MPPKRKRIATDKKQKKTQKQQPQPTEILKLVDSTKIKEQIDVKINTLNFQIALKESRFDDARKIAEYDVLDNSVGWIVGHVNPIKLWAEIKVETEKNFKETKKYNTICELFTVLILTGAKKWLNVVDTKDNLRPIDACASNIQTTILVLKCKELNLELKLDVNPFVTTCPFWKYCTKYYYKSVLQIMLENMDPINFNCKCPVSGDTIFSYALELESTSFFCYLINLPGSVNLDDVSVKLLNDVRSQGRLVIARETFRQYRTQHLPDQLKSIFFEKQNILIPNDLFLLIASYVC
jgi:hypothetical protein